MPKRKTPEEKPADQFKRFQEVAKALDVDDSAAEKAFTSFSQPKNQSAPKKRAFLVKKASR